MRILFLHPRFPGPFLHLARALGANTRHTVVFGTAPPAGNLPGVSVGLFRSDLPASPHTHPINRPVEEAVKIGQEAYRLARNLGEMNFIPDVIFGHSGSGPTLFMKDLYPHSVLLCYFEWFHRSAKLPPGAPEEMQSASFAARVRNVPVLTDLCACDRGLSPTPWQRDQFPREYRERIDVIHDGIDAVFFAPAAEIRGLDLPRLGIALPSETEIITTIAPGPEARYGTPLFLDLLEALFEKRPSAQAVVAGPRRGAATDLATGPPPFAAELLEGRGLDPARVHFTGPLDPVEYRQLLQASRLHLHLASHQVLPGVLLEALSTGCLVLAVDHPALREAIRHGENGFLASSADRVSLLAHSLEALERGAELDPLRERARQVVLENYAIADLLPRQIAWIEKCLG